MAAMVAWVGELGVVVAVVGNMVGLGGAEVGWVALMGVVRVV